jgi:G3E family GTPase
MTDRVYSPSKASVPDQLPIIVLTGFLGSGKTTLLNRLLRNGPRSAVLINEFGSVPIDHKLVAEQDIPLMTLSGGCLCCQVRGALAPALRNIRLAWHRPGAPKFDRIILETSGVASPEPILDTLLSNRWLSRHYQLDAIIALIAAPTGEAILDRYAEAQAQIAWADRLWISQTDLATPAQSESLRARLEKLAPATPIFQSEDGDAALAALSRPLLHGPRPLPEGHELTDHPFHSLAIQLFEAVNWSSLQAILNEILAAHTEVVRIKGMIHLTDQFDPVAIHAVAGHLFAPVPLSGRVIDDRLSRLVFITEGSARTLADALINRWPTIYGGARTRTH